MERLMTVTVIATTKVKPEAADGYAKAMDRALKETREYDGCISVFGYRNQNTPNHIIAIEQWESREKYEAYVAWRRTTGMMEKLATIMLEPISVAYFDKIA
jgi:quinol monooxygenase YgiN